MPATVTLLTEDGQRVSVDRTSAGQMGILRAMLEMGGASFPVPAVKSTILGKVVEFLDQHRNDPTASPILVTTTTIAANVNAGDANDDDDDNAQQPVELHDESSGDSSDEYFYEDYLAKTTPWDQRFLDSQDLPTLIELTKAANYLNVPLLLDLCCRTIAKQMTGLKAEELRKKFNLPNDFTPEEEAKMAAEFAWIDE